MTSVGLGLTSDQLSRLRSELRGPALGPTDPGFEEGRIPFNAMLADRPDVVVRPTGTADVAAAVRVAREYDLEVVVRGGGHSVGGLSTADGGMVIDLSAMHAVDVDPSARLARVQGGGVLGELDRETQLFGLAAPVGVVSETGVAGLTLGGGYGWLRRKYGLACDNLFSAQVVCADGEVRTASAETNPDLFWAIRGGGGNFGIVTSFTFKLHPVGPIVAFAGVFYPVESASEVLSGYRAYFADAPDEVTAEALSITMPADPSLPEEVRDWQCLVVGGVYAGDHAEGMDVLRPLRELAAPLADISQPMPFAAVQSAFDGFFPRGQIRAYWKSPGVRRGSRRRGDRDRRQRLGRAAEPPALGRRHVRNGRRHRPGVGAKNKSGAVGSVHGHGAGELDRRRRRRCEHRLGSWRLEGRRRSRRRVHLPQLLRRRRCRAGPSGCRLRLEPRAARPDQGSVRPGERFSPQQQHRPVGRLISLSIASVRRQREGL